MTKSTSDAWWEEELRLENMYCHGSQCPRAHAWWRQSFHLYKRSTTLKVKYSIAPLSGWMEELATLRLSLQKISIFGFPQTGNFIGATLRLQTPPYQQQAHNQEEAKRGPAIILQKHTLLHKVLLVKLNLDLYTLRKLRETSIENVLHLFNIYHINYIIVLSIYKITICKIIYNKQQQLSHSLGAQSPRVGNKTFLK